MQLKFKTFITSILLVGACCSITSKSLTDFWNDRPKTFMCGMEKKAKFKTDTLTNDFMTISITKVSNIQIKRLPTESKDSIMCIIHTFDGPAKESKVSLFTQDWMEIETFRLPTIDAFFHRPDSMSTDSFRSTIANIDTYLLSANLSPNNNNITIKADFPLSTKDETDKVRKIYKEKVLSWDGKIFK